MCRFCMPILENIKNVQSGKLRSFGKLKALDDVAEKHGSWCQRVIKICKLTEHEPHSLITLQLRQTQTNVLK